MTSLINNVEATFLDHISMFQQYFQLDTMTLASNSYRKCRHITLPDNYKLVNFCSHVTRSADMVIGSHIAHVNAAATYEIICHRLFWLNFSHHIKRLIVTNLGVYLVSRRMINYDADTECESDLDSDSEVNVGEEVNVSDVVPVSGELSTGAAVNIV